VTTLAFAGSGRITIVHALAAQALGLPVGAVASRDAAHAAERAEQVGARVTTYDALPGDADLIVVATPPRRHASDCLRALDGGAAVLVEKPLCTTLTEADRLVAHGGRLVYAENLAFAPVVEQAVALTRGLGPLRHLEVRSMQGRPDWGDFLTTDWGGGALFDLGVHPVAVALLLAAPARVVEVSAVLEGADDIDVDEHAEVRLRFDSGLTANVVASWRVAPGVWDLQAASDAGVVRAELIPAMTLERDGEAVALAPPRAGVIPELDAFGYVRQLEVAAAVAAGSVTHMDAAFGRRVLDVVCAAYASAGRGGTAEPVPFTGSRDRSPWELWRSG
jgi:predicted dehydrogenase